MFSALFSCLHLCSGTFLQGVNMPPVQSCRVCHVAGYILIKDSEQIIEVETKLWFPLLSSLEIVCVRVFRNSRENESVRPRTKDSLSSNHIPSRGIS